MTKEFDAADWFSRLKAAGGSIRLDAASIYPTPGTDNTPERAAILSELQGPENEANYRQVEALLRSMAGPLTGWQDL